jgi:hypothetical protein
MLGRCYGVNKSTYPEYGGRGITVCTEWHNFQNFVAWYDAQYKEDGWHIDKDILFTGPVPIYQPETCVLVPPKINAFFATVPKSISIRENKGGFGVQVSMYNRKYYIRGQTEGAVEVKYWDFKRDAAVALADEFLGRADERVIAKLRNLIPITETYS